MSLWIPYWWLTNISDFSPTYLNVWKIFKVRTKKSWKLYAQGYLDLFLCELCLCCQAADLSHGGVRELLICGAQQRVGVHSGTVGGDAAKWNQQLGLNCCCVLLGLEGREHLEQRQRGMEMRNVIHVEQLKERWCPSSIWQASDQLKCSWTRQWIFISWRAAIMLLIFNITATLCPKACSRF